MAGIYTKKEKLNHTLEYVSNTLNTSGFGDWFIFFGTLLGIVREDSCIDGDDDIDIMINCDYWQLRKVFEEKGFSFTSEYSIKTPDTILKTNTTSMYCSIDFYFCTVNNRDYFTPWHKINSTNSTPIVHKKWRSCDIQLPNNYTDKIVAMYGSNWKIPQSMSCRTGMSV